MQSMSGTAVFAAAIHQTPIRTFDCPCNPVFAAATHQMPIFRLPCNFDYNPACRCGNWTRSCCKGTR